MTPLSAGAAIELTLHPGASASQPAATYLNTEPQLIARITWTQLSTPTQMKLAIYRPDGFLLHEDVSDGKLTGSAYVDHTIVIKDSAPGTHLGEWTLKLFTNTSGELNTWPDEAYQTLTFKTINEAGEDYQYLTSITTARPTSRDDFLSATPPLYTEDQRNVFAGIWLDSYVDGAKVQVAFNYALPDALQGAPYFLTSPYPFIITDPDSCRSDMAPYNSPERFLTFCHFSIPIPGFFEYYPGDWQADFFIAPTDGTYPAQAQATVPFKIMDNTPPVVTAEDVPDSIEDAWLSLSGEATDNADKNYAFVQKGVESVTWEAEANGEPNGGGQLNISERFTGSEKISIWRAESGNPEAPEVIQLRPGGNTIKISAKDGAGNDSLEAETPSKEITVHFTNHPPQIRHLEAKEFIADGGTYTVSATVEDQNRNLKEIRLDWDVADQFDPSPEETKAADPGKRAEQQSLTQSFSHQYQFESLPPNQRPLSISLSLGAVDSEGETAEREQWDAYVLPPGAEDNDCKKTLVNDERLVADPVNVATGAQVLEHRLLSVQGALPLHFTLRYNSLLLGPTRLGRGWEESDYGARLERLREGGLLVLWSPNRYNRFEKTADGWRPTHVSCGNDTLVAEADGGFTLTRRGSLVYRFDAAGRLVARGNTQGQFLHFHYDAQNRLSRVEEPLSGAFLAYEYTAENRLERVSDPVGRNVLLHYDAAGRLTRITDAAGQAIDYTYTADDQLESGADHEGRTRFINRYDAHYRIAEQQDGRGGLIRFSYDDSLSGLRRTVLTTRDGQRRVYTTRRDDLQLLRVENALGHRTVDYEYDAQGRRISRADANGNVTRYTYDAVGNLHTVTDPAGATTTLEYDAARNPTRAVNALGRDIRLSYDADNRLISKTDPAGHITRYEYNTDGQLLKITRPRGGVTRYSYSGGLLTGITQAEGQHYSLSYDAAGRLLTVTDAENHTTALEYDGNNRITALVDPLGRRLSLAYDSRDNILSVTDANGNVTRREYDGEGNLIKQINALLQETVYQYDSENRLIAVTDANNHTERLHYDAAGQLTGLTDALGHSVSLSYDAAGNLLQSVDALGNTVRSLNYNVRNQVTQSTDALGHSDRYQYDVLGRLNQDSDPLDNSTAYNYDSLNRLIQSIDALQGQSAQDYDADGNRTTLTDPEGNQTWFSFDLSGRLTESRTAANSPMRYSYNARDLITQLTNGRGQNHDYRYDAAGRLVQTVTPEGATAYTYDNNGNVLTVTDASGTISRQYDALNRVVSYTDASGNHIGYEYDAVGNLVTLTYPDGKQVHYEYDVANHLVKVTDWANRETAYSYDANGRLIETRRPNGTKQTRAYDAKGQLLSQTDSDAAGNVIARFGFTYDTSGDISEETGLDESALDGRLSQPEMTYGPGNRLATYNGETVQFDADGNLIRGPLNGAMDNFVYDSGRRLIQAGAVQYAYDAENHRIGADGARFVVNSQPALSQVLVKTATDGARTVYVYGLGLIGEESAAGYKAYHFDFRGSTVALSDASGAVAERFSYSAYGVLLSGDVTLTPFLFNGLYGVMTDANGLYHMRARFYSAEIRRFLNRDVLVGDVARGQSLNRFGFVSGKPILFIDPFGLAEYCGQCAPGSYDCLLDLLRHKNQRLADR